MTSDHTVVELFRLQPIFHSWEIRNFDLFLEEDSAAIWKKMVANDGAQDNAFNLTIMRTNSNLMTVQVETSEDYDVVWWVSKKVTLVLTVSTDPTFSEVFEFDFSKFSYDEETAVYLGEFDFYLPSHLSITPGMSLFAKTVCKQLSQRICSPPTISQMITFEDVVDEIEDPAVPSCVRDSIVFDSTQDSFSDTLSNHTFCTGISAELDSNNDEWDIVENYSVKSANFEYDSDEVETAIEDEASVEDEDSSSTEYSDEEDSSEYCCGEDCSSSDYSEEEEDESESESEQEEETVLEKLSRDLENCELQYAQEMDDQSYFQAVETRQKIHSILKAINIEKAAIARELKAAECEKIKSQIDELAKKYSQLMETSQFHEANEISHQMADLEKQIYAQE